MALLDSKSEDFTTWDSCHRLPLTLAANQDVRQHGDGIKVQLSPLLTKTHKSWRIPDWEAQESDLWGERADTCLYSVCLRLTTHLAYSDSIALSHPLLLSPVTTWSPHMPAPMPGLSPTFAYTFMFLVLMVVHLFLLRSAIFIYSTCKTNPVEREFRRPSFDPSGLPSTPHRWPLFFDLSCHFQYIWQNLWCFSKAQTTSHFLIEFYLLFL